jgi:hypothetical protein
MSPIVRLATRRTLIRWVIQRLFVVTLVAALLGCEQAQAVPPGAQLVHVAIGGGRVQLSSVTAVAGDVYFVIDATDGGFTLIRSKPAENAKEGPMSNLELGRLARGDTQGMAIESFTIGCAADQRAAARGRTGLCGNVYPITLQAGKYALLAGDVDPTGQPGVPITILEVVPSR